MGSFLTINYQANYCAEGSETENELRSKVTDYITGHLNDLEWQDSISEQIRQLDKQYHHVSISITLRLFDIKGITENKINSYAKYFKKNDKLKIDLVLTLNTFIHLPENEMREKISNDILSYVEHMLIKYKDRFNDFDSYTFIPLLKDRFEKIKNAEIIDKQILINALFDRFVKGINDHTCKTETSYPYYCFLDSGERKIPSQIIEYFFENHSFSKESYIRFFENLRKLTPEGFKGFSYIIGLWIEKIEFKFFIGSNHLNSVKPNIDLTKEDEEKISFMCYVALCHKKYSSEVIAKKYLDMVAALGSKEAEEWLLALPQEDNLKLNSKNH